MRVTVENRADQPAALDVLPQILGAQQWSWSGKPEQAVAHAGAGRTGKRTRGRAAIRR